MGARCARIMLEHPQQKLTFRPTYLTMTTLTHFQDDMRRGYFGGATGIMVSGFVWLTVGLVAYFKRPRVAI